MHRKARRDPANTQFKILGPLEVAVDDIPVNIGGRKPRALLATLMLRAGSVVSTDRLMAAVWGESAPSNALAALRAYVSRLRAALPPLPDQERLRYRAPGYVLAATEDELDATRFTRLVSQARERVIGADHLGAVALLDEALALWRGDVLAEFDAGALDAEPDIARLTELRLVATEERAEALMHLGRHREVVGELRALIQRHPDRERLAVLLMRGLYGSGSQAEALTVYQDLRRRLVDELGVEPSEPTRAVHRQLLAQDPALVPAPRVVEQPGNLPRRGTRFVGREGDIVRVAAATGLGPVLTLTGVGGVGKSRMALEVARLVQPEFPDGGWLCELAPLADGGPVSHAVAVALGIQQRRGLSIDQTVIEYLRARKLLLVLDNCEHVLDGASHLLDQLVSSCPGVVVLATSREALGVAGEQVWPVPPLTVAEARALFVVRARAVRPDFDVDHGTEDAILEICRRLDGLPLAIELAAARIRAMSADELAQRLDDGRLLARGRAAANPRHQSLTAAIDWSYRLLSEPEQQLFARMSVLAGGGDLEAVLGVCAQSGATETDVLDLLTALVDKSMVVAASGPGGTRYLVLETLRAYGHERLPVGESLSRRHAEYFTRLAEAAAHGVQGPDEGLWVDRALTDFDNLRSAFEAAVRELDDDLAMRLVTSLLEVSHFRIGYETSEWAERALDLTSEEHPLFAAAVGAAARGAWSFGDFGRARSLAARAGGRRPGPGTGRSGYPADVAADVALYEGDAETALHHYDAEVEVARRNRDPIRLVWTLYYVAVCHAVRRDPESGLPAAQECWQAAESTANPTAQSMARYALGLVLKKADPPRALSLFDEAAELAAAVRSSWWHGVALMEAAVTRAIHGDPAVAAAAFESVLSHWERLGDQTQQGLNLRYIIRLLLRVGAEHDAVVLHHYLLAAGRSSPSVATRVERLLGAAGGQHLADGARTGARLSAAEAVALARSSLQGLH